jgi:hypothetical protein
LAALFLVLGLGFIVVSYLMTGVKPTDLKDAGQYLLGLFASALSAYPLSQFQCEAEQDRDAQAHGRCDGEGGRKWRGRVRAAGILEDVWQDSGEQMIDPATSDVPREGAGVAAEAFQRLAEANRRARQRAVVFTLLPIVVATALVAYTSWQVKTSLAKADEARAVAEKEQQSASTAKAEREVATKDLEKAQRDLSTARAQAAAEAKRAEAVEAQVRDLEAKLRNIGSFTPFIHELKPEDLKGMFGTNPEPVVKVVEEMLRLKERGTKYSLDGTKPEEGLNSPRFAAYVLSRNDVFSRKYLGGEELVDLGGVLRKLKKVDKPEPGDLIVYPSGYVMLYALDYRRKPFVIGMTPAGVLPLEPTFATPESIWRWVGE